MKTTASEATGMSVVVSSSQNGMQYVVRFTFCNSILLSLFGLLVLFQSVVAVKCLFSVLGGFCEQC